MVNRFTADGMWRLRTVLAVLCALGAVAVEKYLGLLYSCGVVVLVLDSTLLLYITCLVSGSSNHQGGTPVNPLGKVALLKVPLGLLSASGAQWFDPVCLFILLVGHLFRDIFIMVFLTTVFKLCIVMIT